MEENELSKKQLTFLEILPKKKGHIGKTCKAVGIGRRTFYNWKGDEIFAEALDDVEQGMIDDAEELAVVLMKGIPDKSDEDGNVLSWTERPSRIMIRDFLRAKAKDRGWGDEIKVTKSKDEVSSWSDEELKQAIKDMEDFEDDEYDDSNDG